MGNAINKALIENYLKENNMCKTKFCKVCKISPATLNKILSGNLNFSITALFKIAKMLKIYVYQLFL